MWTLSTPRRGLSPRVRGNLGGGGWGQGYRRSIPACAGEPVGGFGAGGQGEVYPRVCGGTAAHRLSTAR